MARPQKEGLTYFPLDVDIDQDDKLIVPIAKHGMVGFGVIVKLMMEIYKNGYFYPWTEKEKYVFPFKIGVETEKASEIVIDCINSGFFCKNQYKRNHILTSYGFQKRFLMASTRRKDSTINPLYLAKKELLQTETELLHAETKEMNANSTQSKVNEIKGEEREKVSAPHSTFNNPIKDRIYNFAVRCEIKKLHIVSAEQELFFFIDKMDVEVIEAALSKSIGTSLNYAVKIMTDWMNEGKTTKESIKTVRSGPGEREAELQQRMADQRKNNVVEMVHQPDPMLGKVVGND